MKLSRLLMTMLAGLVLTCVPGIVSASPLGTLDISGIGNVRVGVNFIDFAPLGGGTGVFNVSGTDQNFLGIPLGSLGTIKDLADPPATPGTAILIPSFITVPTPGTLFTFSLERIFLGGGPACTVAPTVGNSCSPTELVANTPFLLTQNRAGVSVSFSVLGTLTDNRPGATAPLSLPYRGLFTAQFTKPTNDTVPEILASLVSPGYVESSWSAEFTSVPEPVSFVLIGGGLIGLALGARRRHVRS